MYLYLNNNIWCQWTFVGAILWTWSLNIMSWGALQCVHTLVRSSSTHRLGACRTWQILHHPFESRFPLSLYKSYRKAHAYTVTITLHYTGLQFIVNAPVQYLWYWRTASCKLSQLQDVLWCSQLLSEPSTNEFCLASVVTRKKQMLHEVTYSMSCLIRQKNSYSSWSILSAEPSTGDTSTQKSRKKNTHSPLCLTIRVLMLTLWLSQGPACLHHIAEHRSSHSAWLH